MNIVFLVFRNSLTGYGHWYRSKALADYLKSKHHKITIIGDYLSDEPLTYHSILTDDEPSPLSSTLYSHILEPWYDWIVVDLPFELDKQFYLACKSKKIRTLILNGVGHHVGDLADLRIVQGLGDGSKYSGSDYVILRPEIMRLKEDYKLRKLPSTPFKWFVYGGGFDVLNLKDVFIDRWIKDDFMYPGTNENFLQYTLDCNRACLSMGMIVWELLTIGLKCYVFSSSQKHLEFAQRMDKTRLIRAYDKVGLPKSKDEFVDFLGGRFELNEGLVPDGKAVERIEGLMK